MRGSRRSARLPPGAVTEVQAHAGGARRCVPTPPRCVGSAIVVKPTNCGQGGIVPRVSLEATPGRNPFAATWLNFKRQTGYRTAIPRGATN